MPYGSAKRIGTIYRAFPTKRLRSWGDDVKTTDLKVGQSVIDKINCDPRNKQLLMNMGLLPGRSILIHKIAPLGDRLK